MRAEHDDDFSLMNARFFLFLRLRSLCAVVAGFAVACAVLSSAPAAAQLYTCGMHPQIIKQEPGNCPICGMKLTPIRANAGAATTGGERKVKFYRSTMDPMQISDKPAKDSMGMDMVPVYEGGDVGATTRIQIEAAMVQRMNLKTAVVARGPVAREIRTVGTIAYHEQGLRDITLKYEGWIEKLLVNTTWAKVKAGEPLFEIYSPDLYNAQLNYVVALRSEGAGEGPLKRAALARLQLFDIPVEFIAEVTRTGEPRRTIVFRAPADGVVIEKMAVAGQMMKPGEPIYRLADLSSVWALAQIYEQDLPFVQPGQEATVRVTYGAERTLTGKVEAILPQIEEQTRAAIARIVLPNPEERLRPGMFVDVRFSAQVAESAVLVPDVAVLRSGERNTVFIARPDGSFEPREVKLGARTADHRYQVLNGLTEGDRVVTSGQFLLDSESQLREAIEKMRTTEAAASAGRAEKAREAAPNAGTAAPGAEAVKPLALAAAEAAAALAADDLVRYKKSLPPVRDALAAFFSANPNAAQEPLGKFKDGPGEPKDLEAARREFEPFSTAVADLARQAHLQHTAGLHVFECRMSPVLGKGRWVQRDAGAKNPFFGAQMLTCGEELK